MSEVCDPLRPNGDSFLFFFFRFRPSLRCIALILFGRSSPHNECTLTFSKRTVRFPTLVIARISPSCDTTNPSEFGFAEVKRAIERCRVPKTSASTVLLFCRSAELATNNAVNCASVLISTPNPSITKSGEASTSPSTPAMEEMKRTAPVSDASASSMLRWNTSSSRQKFRGQEFRDRRTCHFHETPSKNSRESGRSGTDTLGKQIHSKFQKVSSLP